MKTYEFKIYCRYTGAYYLKDIEAKTLKEAKLKIYEMLEIGETIISYEKL